MKKINSFHLGIVLTLLTFQFSEIRSFGQFVSVGDGGYTTQFPGVDAAGRNTYPSGTPNVSGIAADQPIPTNDWWSALLNNNHVSNLFNYPYTLKTVSNGLVVSYIPWGVIDDLLPVTVGVSGINAYKATVTDFSDWTVTMEWDDGSHNFQATSGIGMPFLYFTKGSSDLAQVRITSGTVSISNEMIVITDAKNGADFAVYAPFGSTWSQNGDIYTSDLNGNNYWSLAFIPLTASNVQEVANEYKKYAYVFPVNTSTSWNYDESTSVLRTDFVVETNVKEGSDTTMLLGLLPHHWDNLANNSPYPEEYSYETIRGEMKTLDGNRFSVENTFFGILPTLPFLDFYSEGFSPAKLDQKVKLIENDGLATWTDSYNEGQSMNRLIQTARVADLYGNTEARDKIVATVKDRLEDWLLAEAGEVAFLFYYNSTWTALIGYPAGHGQDGNLNDHHFHWGYFIHAAAFVEQFEPGWAEGWGEMIDYLVRDAACSIRTDEMFPFLRNFSPYAGHCWANGFATFPQGNDQESTSESMQFNSSLIHWGTITGNDEIRDLGIYLYTTEQTAVEEYWFDMYERNFGPTQQYSLVSRVWGNSYDNGTFWTNDIAASYGIELYPIHGGSLYLGHNHDYAQSLWDEMTQNTGILMNQANDNLWHDVYWEYQAFTDPQAAIDLYDSYPDRSLKYGISDAQTYHWLHAMNALGTVDASITADYPTAASFNSEGEMTYVAHNYSDTQISVAFSDGYILDVPANKMATSKDISLTASLTSNFPQAFINGSVELNVAVSGGTATKIEFFDGEELLSEVSQLPYTHNATNLNVGIHGFYARVYEGDDFNITNIASVMVGRQLPYIAPAVSIPGTIQAGLYDKFEGGIGQGISYVDVSVVNEGGFRPNEYVDASDHPTEGAVVGWIASGEWLEYSIDVQDPGFYNLSFRYACDNDNGGGPFHLELDGNQICDPITVNSTGDWDAWSTKLIYGIPLSQGEHILRLFFTNGELNLGSMTFSYLSPLNYDQPVADAGDNIVVVIPENSTSLDGTGSYDPGNNPMSYQWTQIFGPSVITFSDDQIADPDISNLIEGYYYLKLEVSNGDYSDEDEMYVIVSPTANIPPVVSIVSPKDNSEFMEGTDITITAEAFDMNGSIQNVKFYADEVIIGTVTNEPYTINWAAPEGEYEVTSVATDNEESSTTSAAITVIVTNNSILVPGRVEAENYVDMLGIETEPCLDIGGGLNVGWIDPGDWMEYIIEVTQSGQYDLISRISGNAGGTLLIKFNNNIQVQVHYTSTGGWQNWQDFSSEVYLEQGTYVMTAVAQSAGFNINYFDIELIDGIDANLSVDPNQVLYYPNPVANELTLSLPKGENSISVFDFTGKKIDHFSAATSFTSYDMNWLSEGIYIFEVINKTTSHRFKIIKK